MSVDSYQEISPLQTRPIFIPHGDDLVPLDEPVYLDLDCITLPEDPPAQFTHALSDWNGIVQEKEFIRVSKRKWNSNTVRHSRSETNNRTRHDSLLEPHKSPDREKQCKGSRQQVQKEQEQEQFEESSVTVPKMSVLVLGNGAKEHALAWKLSQSHLVENVYVSPGNGGTATATDRRRKDDPPAAPISNILEGRYDSWEDWAEELVELVPELGIGLVVVGERQLLIEGAKKYFDAVHVPCLAPCKTASILESIDTARTFMEKNHIPCAEGGVFDTDIEAIEHFYQLSDPRNIVIKTSQNLGVGQMLHPNTKAQGREFLTRYFTSPTKAGDLKKVAIEDVLYGEEVYATILTDGTNFIQFPLCRVRSRRAPTENTPNTPGMGVVVPYELAGIEASMIVQLVKDTLAGLQRENHDYRGALSIRLFLTSSGPKVVEYRLGFQALLCETFLPLLDADLAQLFLACTTRTLHSVPFRFHDLKACNVVMVTDDYPNNTQTNIELSFKQGPKNTFIFHEDTKWDAEGGLVRGVGGRIYSSVGIGPQMSVARRKALEGMKAAKFDRMVYRKDIGAVERS